MAKTRRRKRRTTPKNDVSRLHFHQLDRGTLRNRFAPVRALNDEQLELIDDASMRLLEEQGIEVIGELALQTLRAGGAQIDAGGLVRLDRGLVREALGKAPATVTVTPRNPENTLFIGEDVLNFGLVSGPPNVHDALNGRRPATFADYCNLIRLGQYFNVLSFFGNQAVAPTDLPANTRHLDTTYVNLTVADKAFFAQGIGAGRALDAIEMCAIARGIDLETMVQSPAAMTNININSPRKLDDSMAYGAMQMAKLGQPVCITPFTLMGAMTPASLAGALVQQNAEALFGIVLLQLTRPGTPVIYGGFTSNVDMRSGSPAFGTPENALANMAGGQLARFYRLPHRTSACNASNCVDPQAVYETQMALWGAVLGHGHLIYHAAGWLEGGLVASFEKVITDCEMLQQMSQFLQPPVISALEIGLDAIAEVGPGGHFFGCQHTIDRYQNAFYQPFLSDWQNYEQWQQNGAHQSTQRATAIWQRILAEFEPPPIDPAIAEHLEAFVAKRKEELGSAEPALALIDTQ